MDQSDYGLDEAVLDDLVSTESTDALDLAFATI
jgi:hypothetical protein